MPVNISNFTSSFKKDLARSSKFDVFIPVPVMLAPMVNVGKNLQLRCESTELPGRTFATTERKIGSVPVQKYPYQSVYNDVTMNFIVSGDMSEKLFFDVWMDVINPTSNFNFAYRSNYITDIAITQYDMRNQVTYKTVLKGAYPIAVNQLDLDWTNENYHKLSVMFAYTNWEFATVKEITQNIYSQAINSFL